MNTDELFKAILEHGADEAGIRDRFGDNLALYEKCFSDFLSSPNFSELDKAIGTRDYSCAFDAAHALKGLSGNLGLNACYSAICVLVESLRAKQYEPVEAEYALVKREIQALKLVLAGEQPPPAAEITEKPNNSDKKDETEAAKKASKKRFILSALVSGIAVLAVVALAFGYIGKNYSDKMKIESGNHLLETGKQIGLYLEKQVYDDWKIAYSVGESIVGSNYFENDSALLSILQNQRDSWSLDDLMLYMENGSCVYSDGSSETSGTASKTIASAYRHGSLLSIIDSQITYTLPIETNQTYRGSKIVAISVVRDMKTLLDNMDFTTFENEAWIYLTDEEGIIISTHTESKSIKTFNIHTIFDNLDIVCLSDKAPDRNIFSTPSTASFYISDPSGDKYAVSIPISTDSKNAIKMRVFYIVPEAVVNDTMSEFSNQLIIFSVIVVIFLVGMVSFSFFAVYTNKRKQFNAAILAREHMFDLLIKNVRTVFGLFNTDKDEPVYVSENSSDLLGESYWTLEKGSDGYRVRTASGKDSAILRHVNEQLSLWDGKSIFKSDYLCDSSMVPPAYFEMVIYPVGEGGNDFVGIIQDVTATHAREEVTKNALEMAKRSNESKTRFLANMSHDIRTPMNAIINISHFALESAGDPQRQAEYLNTIHDSAEQLMRMINDVIEMSRIESGQTLISAEPFDIKAELLGQVVLIESLCKEKGLALSVNLDGIHTKAVRGDPSKVSQIIMNLLSNAVKFTPRGGSVRLIASESPSLRSDMVNLRFTVKDNGIGISEEDKRHIFEPFSRADNPKVNQIEGTGLGLSICKSYAEAMGGSITCESVENKGSVFILDLFFQKADIAIDESIGMEIYGKAPFRGLRCIVAEDITTNRTIAKTLLERLGFSVETANDGEECVQKFIQSKPGTFDVIYMDIRMPVMDGYLATRMIRQSEHPQAQTIPIIAISANVFAEDVEKSRVAGMDGHIGKPIVSLELIEQTVNTLNIREG